MTQQNLARSSIKTIRSWKATAVLQQEHSAVICSTVQTGYMGNRLNREHG